MQKQQLQRIMIWLVILAVVLLSGTALGSYLAKNRLEKLQAEPDQDSSFRITRLRHEAGFLHSSGIAEVRFQHKCEPGLSFDMKVEYTLHHLPLPWAPVRADLKLLPSGQAAPLLDRLVNGEFALRGRAAMTVLGGYRLDLDMPAISRREGGDSLEIPLNTWKLFYADPALRLQWHLPQMAFRGISNALTVKAVDLETDLRDYRSGMGTLALSVEQIASRDSLVEGLSITSRLEESGGKVDYVTSAGARKVIASDRTFKDLAIEFQLAGLHAESYLLLSRLVQDTCGLQKMTLAESEKAREALKTLLASGGSFSISKFAVAAETGGLEGKLEIALEKHAGSGNTLSFSRHLRATGEAVLRGDLLTQQQKQRVIDSGFARADGDRLIASFSLAGDRLTLNNQPPAQDIDTGFRQALTRLDHVVNRFLSEKPSQTDPATGPETAPTDQSAETIRPDPAVAEPEAAVAPEERDVALPDDIVSYIHGKYQDPRGRLESTAVEVNRDGRDDYIVQLAGGDYCGSAGCLTLVFVSGQRGYDEGYSENTYEITLEPDTAEGLPVLVVSQHGAFCDKPGSESCSSRMQWNGKAFTVLSRN